MNRYASILLMSAMSIIAGCTIEESFIQDEDNNAKEGLITIRATRESDPETKTVRKSDGKVWWVPGDAISLFYGSGANGGSKFTSTGTDTTQVTNFTGTITAITGGGELTVDDTYFCGVYPYSDDVSCDGSSVTMTIPAQQTATPGTFATNTFPSIGRSQGLIMGFYNVCGGWRFSVTKEGVRKVTLKSNNGEIITGKVRVGFNDPKVPEIKEIIDGSDEVVLECPRGEYFEVGKNYYMTILPTVFSSGFTMTFETYTEEGVYNRTAKTTITRSNFSGIANLDNYLTTPYTLKTGNIPVEDANFKAYLVSNFDTNGDGEISFEEAASITKISITTDNIESVRGIEYMENLTSMRCKGSSSTITFSSSGTYHSSSGSLATLDVSNNTSLTELWCYSNQLTTLDVSKNTALTKLYCHSNQLTALNVSNNTSLTELWYSSNQLTTLDVSKNTALTELSCSSNQLTTLDVSKNTALTKLYCHSNQLTALDVSNNTELTLLHCDSNNISTIDVSKNIALKDLSCSFNQLTALDVSKNTALTKLSCSSNQLTTLDVSKNTALTFLYCTSNQLTTLDVSKNSAQTYLHCDNNQLTTLDVSKNTALTELTCGSNQLTTLDVSKNTELTRLLCYSNQLTTLDVSMNTVLGELTCDSNQLTALDVSKNTALTRLFCYSNQLTTLDVSKNTALTDLSCHYNQLTTLDVSKNTALESLICYSNQLTTLDVSKNTALESLICYSNQLTTLDVSKNTALTKLSCSPMSTLTTLYIYQGQEIPHVTTDRDFYYIPKATEIIVGTPDGGNEGTGDEELTP